MVLTEYSQYSSTATSTLIYFLMGPVSDVVRHFSFVSVFLFRFYSLQVGWIANLSRLFRSVTLKLIFLGITAFIRNQRSSESGFIFSAVISKISLENGLTGTTGKF
jgi:Na+-transporting methylmalonyl-CoA/oxaloacetate decarboxylase beta subunit